jgi:3-hydroxyacyl-[acyl-carrier-protein] dehydratase
MTAEILSFIPQRPPFVMIGKLESTDDSLTRTSFTITSDNVFNSNGYFSESGLLENMAQTAAAGTGYRILMNNQPVPVGYIAAMKNVNIYALPKVNETIITEMQFQQTLLNFHFVKGKVTIGGREIANCEFKIFENTNQGQ